jgi:hypothetical protein
MYVGDKAPWDPEYHGGELVGWRTPRTGKNGLTTREGLTLMATCRHLQLVLVRDNAAKVRCRHCHLTIKPEDLPGRYCPECFEATGLKRYDFEEVVVVAPETVRYRCEECGGMIETR